MDTVEIHTTAGDTVEINMTAGDTVEINLAENILVGNQNDQFPYILPLILE